MPVQYIVIPFNFLSGKFAKELAQCIKKTRMSQREVGEYVGRSDSWVSLLLKGTGQETITVRDFVLLCNMFDLNPQDYFELGE